ncbi:MAG: AI-2E family transporter [Gammaproteobacteria bacterium]|nr:MAG: AI-2E family transporter [Gammaproteobacteria bacterium]RKZ44207.1 MAG: AI-2E family transporter [Gammaproteobacteria bacterium]RKZ75400.1 MAG: AI-2E family transporter [Gammaproteobacteria bacterium]
MIKVIKDWFHRYFSDPQAVLLAILLIASFTILMTMSEMLAPVLASLVIAYLLDGLIINLQRWHIPRPIAAIVTYLTFITLLMFIVVFLLPLLSYQLTQLVHELPSMVAKGQQLLQDLPEKSEMISAEQVESIINSIRNRVQEIGQSVLSYSLASIPAVITLVVYSVLVPLLVFFFLKDKETIRIWFVGFLPKEHTVAKNVWIEMDAQMGNYVRGKVYEIFLVGTFSYFPFAYMNLNYAPLLAVLVGLSVIIPYVGAVLVTFPIIIIAYFQWGIGQEFFWTVGMYTLIQVLDGNVLVPLLFSEAVNLHPVAIIMAVLVFGGLWGFWGVFFAIPLATLVKALLSAWPRSPIVIEPAT